MELTKKKIREYAKMFPHLMPDRIDDRAKEFKTERGLLKHLEEYNRREEAAHNEPLPIYIVLDVEWKRSAIWGYNPSVNMQWRDAEGHWHFLEKAGSASGCGYDKHSAAVASALNRFKNLRYSIRKRDFRKAPYGIHKCDFGYSAFEGGVGMECYPKIFQWLGFEMRHVANSNTYDKWVIVKKSERKRFGLA